MLLVNYLRAPDPARWKRAVFTALFALFDRRGMLSGALRRGFDRAAADALPGQVREALDGLPPPVAVAGAGAWTGTAPAFFDLFTAFPLAAVERGDPDAAAVVVHLRDDEASRRSDGYRRVWNGVLRLFTLLQFLPGAWWTTRTGVERGIYPEFPPPPERAAPLQPASGPPAGHGGSPGGLDQPGLGLPVEDWKSVLELAAPEVHDVVAALAQRGAPAPEVGFELLCTGGAVLAEAELAWPTPRIALFRPDQETDSTAFDAAGWRTFTQGADNLAEERADDLAGALADALTGDDAPVGTVPADDGGAR